MTLQEIKIYAERVAGSWNGDESGRGEERASIALDIIEKIKELEELLQELDNA